MYVYTLIYIYMYIHPHTPTHAHNTYKHLHAGGREIMIPQRRLMHGPAVTFIWLPLHSNAGFVEAPVVVLTHQRGYRAPRRDLLLGHFAAVGWQI